MKKPITLIILGAGNRGRVYADYALRHPQAARVVAVAEPRDDYRAAMAASHALGEAQTFSSWHDIAGREKFADAVVIATPDAHHYEPALALAAKGYHLLLEKPIAPTQKECLEIISEVEEHGVLLAIGHVLRYTPYTQALKKVLAEGAIGELISVQHLEPVGYWHQAHSYVRGNWRNEAESAPMLLAKSCHDIDWLCHILGKPCVSVSSFGALTHFKRANKPLEAGDATRCLTCDYEPACPYSAKRIYLSRVARGETGTPLSVLSLDTSFEGIMHALESGPYGRCVYECDNDVVDHQVLTMQFAGGATVGFTMTGFTEMRPRQTRIFGTRGELTGDGETLKLYDFLSEQTRYIDTAQADASSADTGEVQATEQGHGGGDDGLMRAFVEAVASGEARYLSATPQEALQAHLIVFAAERSRLTGQTVNL